MPSMTSSGHPMSMSTTYAQCPSWPKRTARWGSYFPTVKTPLSQTLSTTTYNCGPNHPTSRLSLMANRYSSTVTEERSSYSSDCKINFSTRSEEHTSELQSRQYLVCRLLLEKKKI